MDKSGCGIYHERQSRQLCALHVLNNLLQEKVFIKSDLDDICTQLAPTSYQWWNPHRSPLGLGNYDVNVMMFALQNKDMQAVWFDKRKSLNSIRPSAALGFILNVPSSSKMSNWLPSAIVSLKHWIAIRKIGTDELYFNLDSHLPEPHYIGNEQDLLTYLGSELASDNRELLIVVDNKTTETELWRN